jgi:hypothetical protein
LVRIVPANDIGMNKSGKTQPLGLEVVLQHPVPAEAERIPKTRGEHGEVLYPEMDADGDHVHFEMVPMEGDSLLWLTVRRETAPQVAAAALRKIADLLDRHGENVLNRMEGASGSFSSDGDVVDGPLRLGYDENGDLVIPHVSQPKPPGTEATRPEDAET